MPRRLEQFIEDPSKQLKEQSRTPSLQGSRKQEEGTELPVDTQVSPEEQGSSFQPKEPLREYRPPEVIKPGFSDPYPDDFYDPKKDDSSWGLFDD